MTQLGDLSDDCLIALMDWLPPKQLFKLQRLNKRMKRLAAIKIGVKITTIEIKTAPIFSYASFQLDLTNRDQVLSLEPTSGTDHNEQFILSLLSKCAGVKAIDFGDYFKITSDLLLEVFRRCPALECVKLKQWHIKDGECDRVFDQVGQRIVHLAIKWFLVKTFMTSDYFLETVVAKCTNIKRLDWITIEISASCLAKFKLLPERCWIALDCRKIDGDAFEDVVDELNTFTLNWSQLGHRYDRLSKLNLHDAVGPVRGVEFNGLKRLDFNESFLFHFADYLLASRFPRLEEFCFSPSVGYSEDDYEKVFQVIKTVKKLIIKCGKDIMDSHGSWVSWFMFEYPKLPQLSVFWLENLDTIYLIVLDIEDEWQPNDFLEKVEQYVDEVGSLKKLTFYIQSHGNWDSAIEELVKRLKLKQSRVEVALVDNLNC